MKTVSLFRAVVVSALMMFWLCLSVPASWSQTYNFRTREASVVKTAQQIKDHNGFFDTIVVRQDKWDEMIAAGGSWNSNLKFKSVHAFVKFYVNHAYPVKIQQPYTFRLAYRIYGYSNMTDTTISTFTDDTLTISYKPDSLAAFADMQYKKYSNFHKIMIVMTGLYKITGAGNPPIAMDLSTAGGFSDLNFNVEGAILVQPYHKRVKVGGSYEEAYGIDAPQLEMGAETVANDYLPVRWNFDGVSPLSTNLAFSPVNYELEWTYIDNYKVDPSQAIGGITTISASNLKYDFRDNSTRIWLDTNYYKIPLIYQKGYLVYRVRAVRPDSVQYRYPIYGPWTLADTGIVSSVASNNKYEITQAHLNDSLNWQYTVSFAEQGKYKHVMSYYDGMLKNRQSITRFNSMPGKLIATEQVYDYEGRPSISLLPTPVSSLAFRYQFNLTLNEATGLPYRANDFDTLYPDACPLDRLPPRLGDASPAYQYYSPANPDQAGFQKFVPDAGGYPFVQTIYSPGYDERVEKQGGAGDTLQIGRNHNVKNDYVNSDQMDLNRLFGIDIGWSGFYRKTVSRDPNGQLSLNVTDYKGKTVTSSMVGIPDTTLHAIVANENLPDTSFYIEDHIAGTTQQVMGNKKILDKNFFNDAGGNNQSQYIYTFAPYPTFCTGKYLSVKARYDYSVFDECGLIQLDTGGTLGTTGVVLSGNPVTDSSDHIPFYMEKGKHSLHKELTINTNEVEQAVDEFMAMSPEENCLKTEPWFIKQSVLTRQFPCDDEGMDCDTRKRRMMDELWPNKDSVYIVRKYGIYHKVSDSVIGNNNSIFTIMADTIPSGSTEIPPTIIVKGYRYQDTCLVHLPASVTKFGHTYTNLQSLPVDTFIYIFNDSIAEALLPLHPEYCKLLECNDDRFIRKMNAIPNAAVAQQIGLFRLNDIIAADPVYARMLTMPSSFPSPFDTLAFTPNGNKNLDTLALIHAYCNGQDSVMMQQCYSELFNLHITTGILNNDYVKERYFEMIRGFYLTNRQRYVYLLNPLAQGLGDCSTCSAVRMTLVPPPVFPDAQNTDPAAVNMIADYSDFLQGGLGNLQALSDSAYTVYNNYNAALCTGPVDQIIAHLVNCADSVKLVDIKNSLLSLCSNGLVANGNYTPEQIRWAIQANNVSLNDLCNPYLVNYDNNMSFPSAGLFHCNVDSFYTDAALTLNNSAVLNRLKTPGTSASYTLSSGNLFEQELINTLGGTACTVSADYSSAKRLYTLSFVNGSNTAKIFFKAPSAGTCSIAFNESPGESVSVAVRCINESPFANAFRGYIGRYTFATEVIHTSGSGTSSCVLPSWNDAMLVNSVSASPIAGCIPCTQMRDLYLVFRDTLLTYDVKGVDHPYYNTMLRNFMNYKLKKAYTLDQYENFIESCALGDSVKIGTYVAYAYMNFTSVTNTNNFLDQINAAHPGFTVTPFYRNKYLPGGTEEVYFDFNQLPVNKLRIYAQYIKQYAISNPSLVSIYYVNNTLSSYGTAEHMGFIQKLSSSSFNPASITFPAGGGFTFTIYTGAMQRWNGTSYDSVTHYGISTPTPGNYATNSQNMHYLRQYLYDNNIPAYLMSNIAPTVNDQYTLSEKKAYLQYAYQYQNELPGKVLDSLQATYVESRVGSFNGQLLSYGHPAEPGNINNLYYADGGTATNGTQYSKLTYIIDQVKNELGNNELFFDGNNTRNIPVSPGQQLTAYRCGDTAFWYRYFGPGDTLYNVFIRVPAYFDISAISNFQWQGTTFNLGEEESRSFKVTLLNSVSPYQTITLDGYTDFTVARNKVLRNVLLAHGINDTPPPADTVDNCERQRLNAAIYEGKIKYKLYIDSIRTRLISDFYAYIMSDNATHENLYIGYRNQRFNYTLYYYDRAGNLMRTVPPAGVSYVPNNMLNGVNTERTANTNNTSYLPEHHKESDYHYNSLNQVVEQETPDGGRTEYFYDAAGRCIFSQNARQRQTGNMTYTLYDKQGRIVETGQARLACENYFEPFKSPADVGPYPCSYYVNGELTPFHPIVHNLKGHSHEEVVAYVRSLTREEVVLTHYDTAAFNLAVAGTGMSSQENLRKRVSCIKYFDFLQPVDTPFAAYDYAMHFSYDIAGNVKTLTRDYPDWKINKQQFKRVDYDYDVISGKVNLLSYNRSFADQYFQRYSYDGDNRITKVETSADGYIWKRDAGYEYYQHGPLARMSLGDLRVQGVDYAYTIQGWLKAVNGDLLDTAKDMGGDATGNSVHARDAVALSLDYFKGDYRPIGGTAVTHIADLERNMYNGNIPRATTAITPFPTLNTRYEYDQLNRIIKAQYAYVNPYDATMNNTADYYSKYAYDPDGNLQKLVRNGNAVGSNSQLMDSLEYHYQPNAYNNRLQNVTDVVANTFHNDIKHYTNTGASRYLYDATGNTIKDLVSGQDSIVWNHYNKVTSTRRDSLGNNLDFAYDGAGNRYLKTVVRQEADTTLERSDYYVRDAQGNILAVYDAENRYQMTKEEWVEYITLQLAQAAGQQPFLEHIAQHYAQEGHFKNSVINEITVNSVFTAQIADNWPVSFFVQHSAAVKNNLLAHTGDYTDFYNELNAFSEMNAVPILGAALYPQLFHSTDYNKEFLSALFSIDIGDDIRMHALNLLCVNADSLTKAVMQAMELEHTTNCNDNATIILTYLYGSPEEALPDFTERLSTLVTYNGFGDEYWNFIQALSMDGEILGNAQYTSIAENGVLIPYFQEALLKDANDSLLGAYIDTWTPARALLKETNGQEALLAIAYDNAPADLIESYVNNHSGDLALVNNGLAAIPGLSPSSLLGNWNPVLVVDSIIHTIYENVLHSRRVSLSEHHLYGSSRLGTKEYLPGEYYQNWDYSTTPAIVDTATLNTRRAWYSMEYNDAISGLVQQPWGQTDVSAYQAGHTLGQKQYELTNHLGNVQATLSDYPSYHAVGTGDTVREHNPALVTAYDYYPFGMLMPGRGTDSLSAISNVLGNILILYTDFSDNTYQGWQPGMGTSVENNRMKVEVEGPWHGTYRDVVLTPGKQYRARVNYDQGSMITAGPVYLTAVNGNNGATLATTGMYSSGTGYEINFTAPAAAFVRLGISTPGTTPTGISVVYYWDNFLLEEIKPQPEVPPTVSDGCITMTQSKWVTHWVDSCYYVSDWTWPNYDHGTYNGGATSGTVGVSGSNVVANLPSANEYISFGFSSVPDVSQSIELEVNDVYSGSPTIQVLEEQGGAWVMLATQSISSKGTYTVNFVPSRGDFRVTIPGPYHAALRKICVKKPALKQENVLVTICPEDKDKYRFGFNGQEKVNEWAGIGNFMEFSERGQDTRTGRFITYDPLAKQYPWNSPYAFAENRPIDGIDLEGREFLWFGVEKAEKILLGTSHLKTTRERVTNGFIGRAKEVGSGLVNLVKHPPLLATADPGIAKRTFEADMAAGKALADNVQAAAHGNPEAAGSLLFDISLFYASNYGAEVFTIGKGLLQAESKVAIQSAKVTFQETRSIVQQETKMMVETHPTNAPLIKTPREFLDKALKRQNLTTPGNGLKETWIEGGYKYEVRIHPANPEYGQSGNIYRVSRQKQGVKANNQGYGTEYIDSDGNWHQTSTLKPGKNGNNPSYNAEAARKTHINVQGN